MYVGCSAYTCSGEAYSRKRKPVFFDPYTSILSFVAFPFLSSLPTFSLFDKLCHLFTTHLQCGEVRPTQARRCQSGRERRGGARGDASPLFSFLRVLFVRIRKPAHPRACVCGLLPHFLRVLVLLRFTLCTGLHIFDISLPSILRRPIICIYIYTYFLFLFLCPLPFRQSPSSHCPSVSSLTLAEAALFPSLFPKVTASLPFSFFWREVGICTVPKNSMVTFSGASPFTVVGGRLPLVVSSPLLFSVCMPVYAVYIRQHAAPPMHPSLPPLTTVFHPSLRASADSTAKDVATCPLSAALFSFYFPVLAMCPSHVIWSPDDLSLRLVKHDAERGTRRWVNAECTEGHRLRVIAVFSSPYPLCEAEQGIFQKKVMTIGV